LKKTGLLNKHHLTKPSFVAADMCLPTVKDEDADERNNREVESAKAKGNVKEDFVAVVLGIKVSIFSLPNDHVNNTWQAM
jgi:hypothetical protein